MSNPKISIVIPCYNVEKFLRQCLDSVVNQTLKDIEIICVNDGSTDTTLNIIQEYASNDSRFRIIDKPNSGYGHSMNCGFDMATGEYIGIVESDDYAELNMFEFLYDCASRDNLDVVKSGFFYYYSIPNETNTPSPVASYVTAGRIFCPTTDFESKMEMVDFFNIKPTIWSSIYRTDFIRSNNIRFNETPGASFQDASFNFKVWALAKRVRLVEECFLHYRQDNEASSINNPGKVYCVCDEYCEMQRFLNEHPIQKGILDPVMVRIQYDSYNWNYERLSEPLESEFIKRFSEDFNQHQLDGTLQKEYFEWYKWKTVHQIMEDPDLYHEIHTKIKNGESAPDFYKSLSKRHHTINGKEVPYIIDKILGAFDCIREHGFFYTIKLFVKKVARRISK